MARPIKQGIDYFPLNTELEDSFKLLELTFGERGIKAFGVIIKLYQKAYKENGYFYSWSEDNQLLFSGEINVDKNEVSAYINEAVRRGIFDKEKFDMGIITSRGMQKRFIEITKRRTELTIYEDILIVNVNEIPVNVNNNPRRVEFLLYSGTQRKGKERKEKKRREREQKPTAASAPSVPSPSFQKPEPEETREAEKKKPFGTFKRVLLTPKEYDDLVYDYGTPQANDYINRLDCRIEDGKEKVPKSAIARIRDFMQRDKVPKYDRGSERRPGENTAPESSKASSFDDDLDDFDFKPDPKVQEILRTAAEAARQGKNPAKAAEVRGKIRA